MTANDGCVFQSWRPLPPSCISCGALPPVPTIAGRPPQLHLAPNESRPYAVRQFKVLLAGQLIVHSLDQLQDLKTRKESMGNTEIKEVLGLERS
jgi:hypothetical protein